MQTMVTLRVAAWLIDTAWYLIIAVLISTGPVLAYLQRYDHVVNTLMAALLLLLGVISLRREFA